MGKQVYKWMQELFLNHLASVTWQEKFDISEDSCDTFILKYHLLFCIKIVAYKTKDFDSLQYLQWKSISFLYSCEKDWKADNNLVL